VVTGGTALITVPAMIQFGIAPRTAIATNMVILTMMSLGGALPFLKGPEIDRKRAPACIALTIAGSTLGALLVFVVPATWLPLMIPIAMVAVLVFLLINPRLGVRNEAPPTPGRVRTGYAATLLLAIYGGFFSGGYVTLLIATCVFFFGYSFLRAVVMSRVMNIASSLIASCIFAWHHAIDWKLSAILGTAAFLGGLAGGRWARRLPERLLRAVFITAVAALAIKSLVFDLRAAR
jgi:uncharacterized membrane protein YfcA